MRPDYTAAWRPAEEVGGHLASHSFLRLPAPGSSHLRPRLLLLETPILGHRQPAAADLVFGRLGWV